MKKLLMKRTAVLALVVAMLATALAGCSSNNNSGQTKQSQTEGTAGAESQTVGQTDETQPATEAKTENDPINPDDVALKVGDIEVKAPELFYYYYGIKTQMESYSGITEWTTKYPYDESMTFGDVLKLMVESQVDQMVFFQSRQADNNVTLSDDDNETIENGVNSFFENVPVADQEFYGFTKENVKTTLEHSIISSKVMEAEISKEIENLTDEEKENCKFRTVQHILFKYEAPATTADAETSESGESGESAATTETTAESYKESQKAKAEDVLARAQAGEDFETLAKEFNEDSGFEYSFNKAGQAPDGTSFVQEFVDGGNALKEGEMTIVETEYGYHVMKCISEDNTELQEEALKTAATNKLNTVYQEWLTTNAPTFYDAWQEFSVLNPVANTDESDTTDTSDTSDTAATDATGSTDATDGSDSAQTGESQTNVPETDGTEAGETAGTGETQQ